MAVSPRVVESPLHAPVGASGAAAPPRAPLPNPLALLEAGSAEERYDLLAPAAAGTGPSLPLAGPPGPPRTRSFPHVVGNFPTVVLLPVPGLDEPLDALYRKVRRLLPDLEPMAQDAPPEAAAAAAASGGGARGLPVVVGVGGLQAQKAPAGGTAPGALPTAHPGGLQRPTVQTHRGYHISLSRTVPVRHPQIAPLTEQLAERLGAMGSCFQVSLAGLRSFVNDEGSRSFVSVMATRGSEQICALIRQVDAAFGQHGLPAFHQVPLPHVSVGWLPGDQRTRIDQALRRLSPEGPRRPTSVSRTAASAGAQPAAAGPEAQAAAAAAAPAAAAAAAAAPAGGTEVGGSSEVAALAAAGEVVCSWTALRAVCVVGRREYQVWAPSS
ncbi:hypothetical protein PLESTB_001504400 [Pleodorina starrii]|uniref:U6 snRNA phosphodiesterase 1 n=1 Tax=Pleodorina starrii TaxID=330485 RepID=A0A9W6BWM0_9CHLO|nr:hypothetical protein PLESTB_001504400 [Pleodorina starrii]